MHSLRGWAVVLLAAGWLAWTPVARATETVSVTVAPATVVDGAPVTVTVSGQSAAYDTYTVASQPASAGGCPAGPPAGTAATLGGGPTEPDGTGAFRSATAVPSDALGSGDPAIGTGPGSYRVCAWLTDAGAVTAVSSTLVTVVPVTAGVSITGPSTIPPTDSLPVVTINYSVNAPAALYADYRAVGRPCAAGPQGEPAGAFPLSLDQSGAATLIGPPGGAASGQVRYPISVTEGETVQVCAWIETPGGSGIDAGPASQRLHELSLSAVVRVFSGRSSQRRAVTLTLNSSALASIDAPVRMHCSIPAVALTGSRFDTIVFAYQLGSATIRSRGVGAGGRFTAHGSYGAADRLTIRGRLTGRVIVGTLSAVYRPGPPLYRRTRSVCSSGSVHFTLRARRGGAIAHAAGAATLGLSVSRRSIARNGNVRLTVRGTAPDGSLIDVIEIAGGPRTCSSSEAEQFAYPNAAFNFEVLRAGVSGSFSLVTGPLVQVMPGRALICAYLDGPGWAGQVTPAQAVSGAVVTVRGRLSRQARLEIPLFDDGYNAPVTERMDMILPGCRQTLTGEDVCPRFTVADALVAPLLPSESGVTFAAWLVRGRGANPNAGGPPGLADPHCGARPARPLVTRTLATSTTVRLPIHLSPRAAETLCWELDDASGSAINRSTMPESATLHGPGG